MEGQNDHWVCETCIEKNIEGNIVVFCMVSRKDLFPVRNKEQLNEILLQTPETLVSEFNLKMCFDDYTIIGDKKSFRVESNIYKLKNDSMECYTKHSTLSDVITRSVFLQDEEVTKANCGIMGNVHVKKSIIISFIMNTFLR